MGSIESSSRKRLPPMINHMQIDRTNRNLLNDICLHIGTNHRVNSSIESQILVLRRRVLKISEFKKACYSQ